MIRITCLIGVVVVDGMAGLDSTSGVEVDWAAGVSSVEAVPTCALNLASTLFKAKDGSVCTVSMAVMAADATHFLRRNLFIDILPLCAGKPAEIAVGVTSHARIN